MKPTLLALTVIIFCFFSCKEKSTTTGGFDPKEALASFQLADDFKIELVVSEPMISDPVATATGCQRKKYPVSSETGTTVKLANLGGVQTTIARNDIRQLAASETSAMPAGLEASISLQEMADLLAFLKGQK